MTIMAVAAALLLVTVILLIAFIYMRDFLSPLHSMPGAPLVDPITGDLGSHMRSGRSLLATVRKYRKLYGPVRRVHLFFGELRVEISDPLWAQYVLHTNAKNYTRGNLRGVEGLRLIVGDSSLLLTSGTCHKRLRRFANPGFKQSLLTEFLPVFQETTGRLIEKWNSKLSESSGCRFIALVKDDLAELTLDIIGLTAFSYDFESFSGNSEFSETFRMLINTGKVSMTTYCLPGFWAIARTLAWATQLIPQRFLGKLGELNYFVNRLCKLRSHASKMIKGMAETHAGRPKAENQFRHNGNLIDFILAEQSAGSLSEKELQDMTITFVLAGHETSSLALSWLLLCLAENKQCQQKCHEEIMTVLPNDGATISWSKLQELKYVSACIYEALRLYPPAPYVNRCTISDDVINGHTVPAGTDILVLLIEMHHDPDIWPNPDEFRPDRFLQPPESTPWHAYMPFGAGVHKCIGYQFATTEVTLIAAMLLRTFEFDKIAGDIYIAKAHVTLYPFPDLRLVIKKRTSS